MAQQEQTLQFFRDYSAEWQTSAEHDIYSVIQDRHRAVTDTMKDYPVGSSFIDLGCGTGQLAIQAARAGWKASGVDFAEEMIELARQNNAAANATAEFFCRSVFDSELPSFEYDLISAQGFIEYISLDQLDKLLAMAKSALKPGGAVAIGSRNRLFNLVSMNNFTDLERSLGTIDSLLSEAIHLHTATSQPQAIERLRDLDASYTHPSHHPETGVKVSTRFQFTPADLLRRIESHGLEVTTIYPVHFHAVPVSTMTNPEISHLQKSIARYVSQHHITMPNFLPYSSSFVIKGVRS
jgi:SAM-dependent methyltransferase